MELSKDSPRCYARLRRSFKENEISIIQSRAEKRACSRPQLSSAFALPEAVGSAGLHSSAVGRKRWHHKVGAAAVLVPYWLPARPLVPFRLARHPVYSPVIAILFTHPSSWSQRSGAMKLAVPRQAGSEARRQR